MTVRGNRYVDEAALKTAIRDLYGTAGPLLKIWLVLKHMGFGQAVNVTLGLPFVRASVDHGTALDIAGTAQVDMGSFTAALDLAASLVQTNPDQA